MSDVQQLPRDWIARYFKLYSGAWSGGNDSWGISGEAGPGTGALGVEMLKAPADASGVLRGTISRYLESRSGF